MPLSLVAACVWVLVGAVTAAFPIRYQMVPGSLLLLSAVPVLAGALRLTSLASGGDVTPDNVRFFALPLPVILHILGATTYLVLGAFQFVPSLRQRHPRYHRLAGRVLVKINNIGLINIVLGRTVCPEYIQFDLTPENIAADVFELYRSPGTLAVMRRELGRTRDILGPAGAQEKAAALISAMLKGK